MLFEGIPAVEGFPALPTEERAKMAKEEGRAKMAKEMKAIGKPTVQEPRGFAGAPRAC